MSVNVCPAMISIQSLYKIGTFENINGELVIREDTNKFVCDEVISKFSMLKIEVARATIDNYSEEHLKELRNRLERFTQMEYSEFYNYFHGKKRIDRKLVTLYNMVAKQLIQEASYSHSHFYQWNNTRDKNIGAIMAHYPIKFESTFAPIMCFNPNILITNIQHMITFANVVKNVGVVSISENLSFEESDFTSLSEFLNNISSMDDLSICQHIITAMTPLVTKFHKFCLIKSEILEKLEKIHKTIS